jgi:acetyl esterase/lipase
MTESRTIVYRGMDRAALDAAYNNTAAVTESSRILADWDRRSAALAAAHPQHLDLRYGRRERNRLDFFPGRPGAPLFVFIHGGYWQMRAKETFRFLAEGPLAHGIHVANVGYTLAPHATLHEIVTEIESAIAWAAANLTHYGADTRRLYVGGWSAGGHLTTMSLARAAVSGGLAISGVFDLEPIRLSFLNEKLGLSEEDVQHLSPAARLPDSSPPLMIAYGSGELPELKRQSREYAAARAAAGLPGKVVALAEHNHFTILEELANADGALTALLLELTGA